MSNLTEQSGVNESRIATLINAVRNVSSSLDLDEVLNTIFDSLKELIDYSAAVVCVVDPKTGKIQDLKERGYPPHERGAAFLEAGKGIIGWVIAHGREQLVNDVKSDPRYVKARPDTRSEIAAPMKAANGEVIGVINLEADWADGFDQQDLELLSMFASLAASSIDHTLLYQQVMRQKRVETELELARKVVDELLPTAFPLIPGFDIFGMTMPVREVGGDYFDFFDSISDRFGFLVADVSGKGLAAALMMVAFRAYMHATIINELAMRVVMSRVNRLVYDTTDGQRFITTFYGLIDPENKRMLYMMAGHNPPLLLRANGTVRLLEDGGLPLGIFSDSRYSESVLDFESGDLLVLYTDGITEAVNTDDEEFGLLRLEEVVRRTSSLRAHEVAHAIIDAVHEYSNEAGGPEDDLTVSVVKVK